MRVRFAPSPTGNVHIGNIRVAIFNWLCARPAGGQFILRIEDTDLERSTPEAIDKMLRAMEWLGLNYDEEPLYQTSQRPAHEAAVRKMMAAGHAYQREAGGPVVMRIHAGLFDDSFISAPRDEAAVNVENGELVANRHALTHTVTSPNSGETFVTPINWDALTAPRFVMADGREIDAAPARAACGENDQPVEALAGGKVKAIKFTRRYVFFDDLVLGRREKPLDSLRDFVIVRSDGSPVFHIANVVDDVTQKITHILRGNDHVENTFRHLFIFKALGEQAPRYGHFPMIVNQSGKPYSKRDGDAYVGDFQDKGYLPGALFNYLALCGWAPGDDREVMTREELVAAFTLERVNKSAAQFDRTKLAWMNQQYVMKMPEGEFLARLKEEIVKAGYDLGGRDDQWLKVLAATQRERLETFGDFVPRTRYFFSGDYEYDDKAAKKNLLAGEGAGLRVLADLRQVFAAAAAWTPEAIEKMAQGYADAHGAPDKPMKLGQVAQPLRVAVTGGVVSPGIGETLFLLGKEETLKRLDRTLATFRVV
ncbi:MAG: glutamate--tRNA ligase [Planctomycetes bacterium]|nr:glutamate--tRNA ligase [Planctomycetota bacterium]